MSRNSISISASPDAVFDVLDDAYAYPRWVVGARRIRYVDSSWPAVGSRFHHAIGSAAGELHDNSKVVTRERPRRMTLEVRFRPTGVARVDITTRPTPAGSEVTLYEEPTAGPAARVPRFLVEPLLSLRNWVALQRLRHEVERRSATPRTSS
jgi:uncharacterized protein YndB with AHSA1/START domain